MLNKEVVIQNRSFNQQHFFKKSHNCALVKDSDTLHTYIYFKLILLLENLYVS